MLNTYGYGFSLGKLVVVGHLRSLWSMGFSNVIIELDDLVEHSFFTTSSRVHPSLVLLWMIVRLCFV